MPQHDWKQLRSLVLYGRRNCAIWNYSDKYGWWEGCLAGLIWTNLSTRPALLFSRSSTAVVGFLAPLKIMIQWHYMLLQHYKSHKWETFCTPPTYFVTFIHAGSFLRNQSVVRVLFSGVCIWLYTFLTWASEAHEYKDHTVPLFMPRAQQSGSSSRNTY